MPDTLVVPDDSLYVLMRTFGGDSISPILLTLLGTVLGALITLGIEWMRSRSAQRLEREKLTLKRQDELRGKEREAILHLMDCHGQLLNLATILSHSLHRRQYDEEDVINPSAMIERVLDATEVPSPLAPFVDSAILRKIRIVAVNMRELLIGYAGHGPKGITAEAAKGLLVELGRIQDSAYGVQDDLSAALKATYS